MQNGKKSYVSLPPPWNVRLNNKGWLNQLIKAFSTTKSPTKAKHFSSNTTLHAPTDLLNSRKNRIPGKTEGGELGRSDGNHSTWRHHFQSQRFVYPRDMCVLTHISLVICVSPPKWRPVICVSPTPFPSTWNNNILLRSLTGRTKNPNRLEHKFQLLLLKKLSMRMCCWNCVLDYNWCSASSMYWIKHEH